MDGGSGLARHKASAGDSGMEGIAAEARALAPLAAAIDRDGIYPAAELRALGEAGTFSPASCRPKRTGTGLAG